VVWLGGLLFQSHVLLPALKGDRNPGWGARTLRGARPITWVAIALLLVTGLYNLSHLTLDVLTQTRVGTLLALKIFLVLVALMLSAHRDFGLVSRLARELEAGRDGARQLRMIAWIDRTVILLGAAALYLGLAISRGGQPSLLALGFGLTGDPHPRLPLCRGRRLQGSQQVVQGSPEFVQRTKPGDVDGPEEVPHVAEPPLLNNATHDHSHLDVPDSRRSCGRLNRR